MFYYERKLKKKGFRLIIGVDEAGRGPLAGPVVAAAVALKAHRFKNRIDDSKKLSPQARERAYLEIIGKSVFGIAAIGEKVIDRVNILVATRMAMEKAIARLVSKLAFEEQKLAYIIVDGNLILNTSFPYNSIVRGDAKSVSIASASILAKVTRDRIMDRYAKIYPEYRFEKHKGYPTKEHRAIIKSAGPCLIHRKTFCCA